MKVMIWSEHELTREQSEKVFWAHLEALTEDAFLKKDGKLYKDDEHYHGSVTDSLVKKPSDVQIAAVRLKEALKKQTAR